VYYRLYDKDGEMPSKVSFDPEEPSLGRINAYCLPPPQTVSSIKQCIARVEGNSALKSANLFANNLCDDPLKEGHIQILAGDCPGLVQDKPMALVQSDEAMELVHTDDLGPLLQTDDPMMLVQTDARYTQRIRAKYHSERNFDSRKRVVYHHGDRFF
jgi:hypothetical protein